MIEPCAREDTSERCMFVRRFLLADNIFEEAQSPPSKMFASDTGYRSKTHVLRVEGLNARTGENRAQEGNSELF